MMNILPALFARAAPPRFTNEIGVTAMDGEQALAEASSSSSSLRRRSRSSRPTSPSDASLAAPPADVARRRRSSAAESEDPRVGGGQDRSVDDVRVLTPRLSLSLNPSETAASLGDVTRSPDVRAQQQQQRASTPGLLLPTGIYNLSRPSSTNGSSSRHHHHHPAHTVSPQPNSPHLTPTINGSGSGNDSRHHLQQHHLLSPAPHATTLSPIPAGTTAAAHFRRKSIGSGSASPAPGAAAANGVAASSRQQGPPSQAQHQNNPYPPPPAFRSAPTGTPSLLSTSTPTPTTPAALTPVLVDAAPAQPAVDMLSRDIVEERRRSSAASLRTSAAQDETLPTSSSSQVLPPLLHVKMEPGIDSEVSAPPRASPPLLSTSGRSPSPSRRPALYPSHSSSSTTWTRPDLVDVPHHPHHGVTNVDLTSKGKRRKRLAKACDSCHKNKRRCDGFEPCENCTHNGRECHYKDSNGNKVSAPKSSRRQSSFSAHTKPPPQQQEAEALVAAPQQPPPKQVHQKLSHEDELTVLRDRLADRERVVAALQADLDRKVVEEALRKQRRLVPRPLPAPRSREEHFVAAVEADVDLTEELLRLFFARLHPYTLMFHRATFNYRRYLGHVARPLLLSMCALAAPLCDHPMLAGHGDASAGYCRGEPFAIAARKSLHDWLAHRKRAAFYDPVWEETEMAMAACLQAAYESTMGRSAEVAIALCRECLHNYRRGYRLVANYCHCRRRQGPR